LVGTPPGTSSVSSRCIRFSPCALVFESSSRRSQSIRSTTSSSSTVSSRNPASRSATITTAWASVASVFAALTGVEHPGPGGQLGRHIQYPFAVGQQPLRERPAGAVRAFDRPDPVRPLPAHLPHSPIAIRGHRQRAHHSQHLPSVAGLERHRPLMRIHPNDHSIHHRRLLLTSTQLGQRGRATLLRATADPLEPRLATVPGRAARHERATPKLRGRAAARESVRPGTYPQTDRPASPGQ
jgi:hypothetical protein